MGVLTMVGRAYYKTKFPYGSSHCCIAQMEMALLEYAEAHDGRYPTGESSSEASLSLLYRADLANPYLLSGMITPEKRAQKILQTGGLLGPDSCGWKYVPGLTCSDDEGIAVLWCKVALGHNGQRMKDGGREVVFVGRGWNGFQGKTGLAF